MNNKVLSDCQIERDSNSNSESKIVRDRKNDSDVMIVIERVRVEEIVRVIVVLREIVKVIENDIMWQS